MTGRLPFDPSKMKPKAPIKPARRERVAQGEAPTDALTVSQVTALVKDVLARHVETPVRVVGELSNFNDRGHWYLSLKDEADVLNCVMWSSAAKKVRFTPERGTQVVATGRLDYYGPQGKLQLYIDKLEPVGQGALELRFKQLCEQLRAKGWFDDAIKKPLPVFPQHLAVVTSKSGAAVQDVIKTARQRWAGCRLTVVDVRVQGEGSEDEIAGAIRTIDVARDKRAIDAIIVTRGGGSIEDLWAFNEPVVAKAIHACHLPIVAAIGHETDTTIAELVADRRCSTPTQAAAVLVAERDAEAQHLAQLTHRLVTATRRRHDMASSALKAAERHEVFRSPLAPIQLRRADLDHTQRRLAAVAQQRLSGDRLQLTRLEGAMRAIEPLGRLQAARQVLGEHQRRLAAAARQRQNSESERLAALERQLVVVGPQRVLERGFSYTTDSRGKLIRSVEAVKPGQMVTTRLADGSFDATVGGERKSLRRKRPKEGSEQGGLFEEDGA